MYLVAKREREVGDGNDILEYFDNRCSERHTVGTNSSNMVLEGSLVALKHASTRR